MNCSEDLAFQQTLFLIFKIALVKLNFNESYKTFFNSTLIFINDKIAFFFFLHKAADVRTKTPERFSMTKS